MCLFVCVLGSGVFSGGVGTESSDCDIQAAGEGASPQQVSGGCSQCLQTGRQVGGTRTEHSGLRQSSLNWDRVIWTGTESVPGQSNLDRDRVFWIRTERIYIDGMRM